MNTPSWIVKQVIPTNNYTLQLTFITGEKKIFDCKPLLNQGIFQRLKDISYFKKAHIVGPTVAWDDELDLAPESLYRHSIASQD
ncbi:MAG: DUF2442 domain-containing protein [Candidatus Saccharibacteria bacterium]|nr:DUF2442 domain-containing protein [Candidatus Saccharibacteria bacterium]